MAQISDGVEHEIRLIAMLRGFFIIIHKPWGTGAWNLISEGDFDYIELTVLPVGPHK